MSSEFRIPRLEHAKPVANQTYYSNRRAECALCAWVCLSAALRFES